MPRSRLAAVFAAGVLCGALAVVAGQRMLETDAGTGDASAPATSTSRIDAPGTADSVDPDGTTTTTAPPTTTTSSTLPPVTWPDQPMQSTIDPADEIQRITPWDPLGSQAWGQTQSIGRTFQSGEIGDDGVRSGDQLRFGVTLDPLGSAYPVLEYRISADDPETVGGIRTETSHFALPTATEFWQVLRVRHDDWSGSDDQQIILQWHHNDFSGASSGGPILAYHVRGSAIAIRARYSTIDPPTFDNVTTVDLLTEQHSHSIDQWQDLIIQAKLSPNLEDDPFIRIWRNGELIVDYAGPIGYYQPGQLNFAKIGVYHWLNADNDWDMTFPERSVHVAFMSIVTSPDGRYDLEDLERHLASGLVPPP